MALEREATLGLHPPWQILGRLIHDRSSSPLWSSSIRIRFVLAPSYLERAGSHV